MADNMQDPENIENIENIAPPTSSSGDLEMGSPLYRTPTAVGPACWPAAQNTGTPSTISDLKEISLRCETSLFPLPEDSPTGLPVRVPLLLPGLRLLDKAKQGGSNDNDNSEGQNSLNSGNPQSSTSLVPNDSPRGRVGRQEAFLQLQEHIRERSPYVKLASDRLQAAMRMRNPLPFTLRHVPIAGGGSSSDDMTGGESTNVMDPQYTVQQPLNNGTSAGGMKPPPMMSMAVDPKTGAGLHSFLLEHGYAGGHSMRECRSITFHDFTPDIKTGAHRNVLLRHYEADRLAEIHSYEVELPTLAIDPQTGALVHGTETWLWILIKRQMVNVDMNVATTFVPNASPTSYAQISLPTMFGPSPLPTLLPPNFPLGPLSSQVVFAAPIAHITVHPTSIEKLPASHSALKWRPEREYTVHKRADYDFSHDGVPVFEFSSAKICKGEKWTKFLSVETMGPFFPADEYRPWGDAEYKKMYAEWLAQGGKGMIPCPNKGIWWKEFYRLVEEDYGAWKGIREAMERGKCRIVLRWDELKGEEDEEGEKDWVMVDDGAKDEGEENVTLPPDVIGRCLETEFGTIRKGRGKKGKKIVKD